MNKPKFNIKKYGIGISRFSLILILIFMILGGIMGGLTGALVGLLMILFVWVIAWVVLIPFAGIFIFAWLFSAGMAYILSIAPTMTGLLATNALPYIGLYWLYMIIGSVVCIFMSVIAVVVIIAGIAAILSMRN
jgi:hypothetical protein